MAIVPSSINTMILFALTLVTLGCFARPTPDPSPMPTRDAEYEYRLKVCGATYQENAVHSAFNPRGPLGYRVEVKENGMYISQPVSRGINPPDERLPYLRYWTVDAQRLMLGTPAQAFEHPQVLEDIKAGGLLWWSKKTCDIDVEILEIRYFNRAK